MVMRPERLKILALAEKTPNGFRFTRVSPVSGKSHTMELLVTAQQLNQWANNTPIQDAMPQLSDDEREFLMTGIYGDEWDAFVGKEED